MTINLTKLPKTADRWNTYGFAGRDADYRIENRISEWRITATSQDILQTADSEGYNTLAECRAFVEAYDKSPEPFRSHARWDEADDAAREVRYAQMDTHNARFKAKVDEALGR